MDSNPMICKSLKRKLRKDATREAMQDIAASAGTDLGGVPRHLDIWWEGDSIWYEAEVLSHDAATAEWTVRYVDDDVEETLRLAEHRWMRVLTNTERRAIAARLTAATRAAGWRSVARAGPARSHSTSSRAAWRHAPS